MKVHCKDFIFSSAHCLPDHIRPRCRLLHGHTFSVAITAEGKPSLDNGAVLFFSDLKNVLMRVLDPMDHKVILPVEYVQVVNQNVEFNLQTDKGEEKCILPLSTVYLLKRPVATIEYMADYILAQIWDELSERYPTLDRLELTLSETPSYSATASIER